MHRDGVPVGWTLDLMRRRDDGFRPVMEFVIGESALAFRDQGYEFVCLSAAPLAKAPERLGGDSDGRVLQRILDFLSGAVYALNGTMCKISRGIFVVAPNNYDVVGNGEDDYGDLV